MKSQIFRFHSQVERMNTFIANNESARLHLSGEFRSICFFFTAEALEWLSGTTSDDSETLIANRLFGCIGIPQAGFRIFTRLFVGSMSPAISTTTIKSIFGRNALPSVLPKDAAGQPLTTSDSTTFGRHRRIANMSWELCNTGRGTIMQCCSG